MPGPRSTCRAPAGSASTRPRACWPAKATSRWPARRDPQTAAPISGARRPLRGRVRLRDERAPHQRAAARDQALCRGGWQEILAAGQQIDARLQRGDVRLTVRRRAHLRLDRRPGRRRVEHRGGRTQPSGSGRRPDQATEGPVRTGRAPSLRPGQMVPRRAAAALGVRALLARRRPAAVAQSGPDRGREAVRPAGDAGAGRAVHAADSRERLGIDAECAVPAYEDPAYFVLKEHMLPANLDPIDNKLDDPMERTRLARVFDRGLDVASGYALPIQRWNARGRRPLAQRALADAPRPAVPDARRFAGRLPPAAGGPALGAGRGLPARGPAGPVRRPCGPARTGAAASGTAAADGASRAIRMAPTSGREPSGPRWPSSRATAGSAFSCRRSRVRRNISSWSPRSRTPRPSWTCRCCSRAMPRPTIRGST